MAPFSLNINSYLVTKLQTMSNAISVPPSKSISPDKYSAPAFESRISSQGTNYGNSLQNIIAFIFCNTSLVSCVFVSMISDENRYGNPIFVLIMMVSPPPLFLLVGVRLVIPPS